MYFNLHICYNNIMVKAKQKPAITAKRLADKRFARTEDAILRAFFNDPHITANQLAHRAGIARSTIYNHHHSISRIIPNYENYILAKHSRLINKSLKRSNPRIKTLYIQTLSFILQHEKVFTIFIKTENHTVFEKMAKKLRPASLKDSEKVLDIYTSEVAKLLFLWGQKDFTENDFELILNDILLLTTTARERLLPLLQNATR